MGDSLERMAKNKKKFSEQEIELRRKILNKYQSNVESLKSRELGEKYEESDTEKPLLLKDMQ